MSYAQGLSALTRKRTKTTGLFRVGDDTPLANGTVVAWDGPDGAMSGKVTGNSMNASTGQLQYAVLSDDGQTRNVPASAIKMTAPPTQPPAPIATPPAPLGGVADLSKLTTSQKIWGAVSVASCALGAYHGYKRNSSVGWALWWGAMGSIFPVITPAIALAQGFGKRRA